MLVTNNCRKGSEEIAHSRHCQLISNFSSYGLEPDRFHREEIASQDLILEGSQEAASGTCRPLGYRSDCMSLEDIAH